MHLRRDRYLLPACVHIMVAPIAQCRSRRGRRRPDGTGGGVKAGSGVRLAAEVKMVRVYRPLTNSAVLGNLVLVAFAISVAMVLGLSQVTLSIVLLNLAIAIVIVGVLAFIGSGWTVAGAVSLFFLGPILTRFVLVGAVLSVRVWFLGIMAGWVLGALLRRLHDRDPPHSGVGR